MYNKQIIYGTLFLVLATLASCSKQEVPDNQFGQVQFAFSGTINDQAVSYEAGKNNYVLFTDFSGSGANDVLLMSGEFRDKSAPKDDFLRFQFFGYDSIENDNVLQNVFSQSNFPSYSEDVTTQSVGNTQLKFTSLYGMGAVITWDFGDGTTGAGDSVTHTFPSALNNTVVNMKTFFPIYNCGDSVSNTINLNDPANAQVQFDINVLSQAIDSFQFNASNNFNQYNWDFGNSTTQMGGASAFVTYADTLRKEVELTAISTTSLNSNWKAVVTPSASAPCFAAFSFDVLQTPTRVTSQRVPYRTCVITYKSREKTYRSFKNDASNQSNRSVFILNNATAYEDNPEGQSTIRLNGTVSTFLYNVNDVNDSIPIVSSNVSIAVAHP